jgi:hypothetical protein
MKRLLLCFTVLFSLASVADDFAGPPRHVIRLQPGTVTNVDGTTIMCIGTTAVDTPKCGVSQYAGNTYKVRVGTSEWGFTDGFQAAIDIVKQLKESGICS